MVTFVAGSIMLRRDRHCHSPVWHSAHAVEAHLGCDLNLATLDIQWVRISESFPEPGCRYCKRHELTTHLRR